MDKKDLKWLIKLNKKVISDSKKSIKRAEQGIKHYQKELEKLD